MSLIFSAIVPHPPVLVPAIGKDETKKLVKTAAAFSFLEEELYSTHPDCLIIISPHGSFFENVFTINFCPEFSGDLVKFGDLTVKLNLKGDQHLAHLVRDAVKRAKLPSTMISEPKLDYGSVIPLFFLTAHLPKIQIIQLGFCGLSDKSHMELGQILKEIIAKTNRRVAVIASADLSHALLTESPAKYSRHGLEFDNKIRELLDHHNLVGLLNLDETLVKNAAECGLRSIQILAGLMSGISYNYKELSYESPFGVGYLTANFEL